MIIPVTNLIKRKHVILIFFGTILLVMSHVPAFAQEQPPKPITVIVSTLQHLNFGTFVQSGTFGTVIVPPQGPPSATDNVIFVNSSNVTPALIDVEAIPGTLITITNGPDVSLTGSNTGSMILHIGDSYPLSPFIATGVHTSVTIGGTLTVLDYGANPAGAYSGTFAVTFSQQ
jgi:hypothetical protein